MTRVFWCDHCGRGSNFGDQLGPVLLRRYGLDVAWSAPEEAELISVGSILRRAPHGWMGTILGTGLARPGTANDISRARVLAVRGALTRDEAKLPSSTVLGDPGILVDELLETMPPKRRKAVIVPHYLDRKMRWRHPTKARANILGPARDLLDDIASAEVIYTSSLHALIAADALGVPQVFEPSDKVPGGEFKFHDYVSAFGEKIRPGVKRLTDRTAMAERQAALRSIFRSLPSLFAAVVAGLLALADQLAASGQDLAEALGLG